MVSGVCGAQVGIAAGARVAVSDAQDPGSAITPLPSQGHDDSLQVRQWARHNRAVPGEGASSLRGTRRLRILAELAASGEGEVTALRLCEVSRVVTGVSGAGIMLMSGDLPLGSVCTANDTSRVIEDLQYTLGEGPCVDAYRLDCPVLEPDLADPATPRWLAFTGPAVEAGVRAIFGFPLGVGSARLGALNLYVDRPGPLSDDQHADALVMADVAAQAVLAMQTDGSADTLAAELEEGSNFHYVVHQAAGMISAQLELSVAHALVRLRAHAFATQAPLAAVAAAVVGRRLRFSEHDG